MAAPPGSVTYRVGASGFLDIIVFKVPELSRAVQVGHSGTRSLPLRGELTVAGQSVLPAVARPKPLAIARVYATTA
jgi:protein involved in polysaccharide export with SLBB domain